MPLPYILTLLVFFSGGMLAGFGFLLAQAKRRKAWAANMRECAEINNVVLTNKRLLEERQILHSEIDGLKKREVAYKRQLVDALKQKARVQLLEAEVDTLRKQAERQRKSEDERFGRLIRMLHNQGITLPPDELNELTP